MSIPPLSRRAMLLGVLTGAASAALVALPGASRANAQRDDIDIDVVGASEMVFFSGHWSVTHRAQLAEQFSVDVENLAELKLRFLADARLFDVADHVVVGVGGGAVRVDVANEQVASGLWQCDAVIPPSLLGGRRLEVFSPLRSRHLFPNDSIDAFDHPQLFVQATALDGVLSERTIPGWSLASVADVAPFALSVAGAWSTTSHSVDGLEVYRAPSRIIVDSLGPATAPFGAQVSLMTDARFVGAPAVSLEAAGTSVELEAYVPTVSEVRQGPLRISSIALPAIPAGGRVAFLISWPDVVIAAGSRGAIGATYAAEVRESASQPNRRLEQIAGIDEVSLASLRPMIDVARADAG